MRQLLTGVYTAAVNGFDTPGPGYPLLVSTNPLLPMLASPGRPPIGDQWVFEWKWDGQRGITTIGELDGPPILFSRNLNTISASYPEVTAALDTAARGRSIVVDGELVALNSAGQPDFRLLQRRMHVTRPTASLLRSTPATYFIFDVLEVDGQDIRNLPYVERRAYLDGLALADGDRLQVPPNMTDADGATLLRIAAEHGIEGVVAKRADSTYRPGTRSKSWIKAPLRNSTEGLVCGWLATASRPDTPEASLLLGAYSDSGNLTYIGSVGTGFTEAMRRRLSEVLHQYARADSPFAEPLPRGEGPGVKWVEPRLIATVEYREQSAYGRLRHTAFKSLRTDMSPEDVRAPRPGR